LWRSKDVTTREDLTNRLGLPKDIRHGTARRVPRAQPQINPSFRFPSTEIIRHRPM